MAKYSRMNDPLINRGIKVEQFTVPVALSSPTTGMSITLELAINPDVLLTIVPNSVLSQLGAIPLEYKPFELSGAKAVEWPVGEVEITVSDRTIPTLCIFASEDFFAPEHIVPTLGTVVLQSAGLTIDPESKRLINVPLHAVSTRFADMNNVMLKKFREPE